MRRVLILLLCCLMFVSTAYADNAASGVQSNATVSSDGSCQVSISMTIRLDQPVSGLTLPLGTDLSSVRLNGSNASLQTANGITSVKLDSVVRNITGSVPVMVNFTVNTVVSTDEDGNQMVTVPLLYGFPYPVEQMNFSVTMPGAFDTVPTFLSGYHQQDIESSITSTVSETTVSGSITEPLKDHETLVMTLQVPPEMFPQTQTAGGTLTVDAAAMGVCGGLALLYWLLSMSCLPRLPIRRSTAPEGVTAGSLASYLVRKPADLTMMVVTWAQLGYLIIHMDEHGRVMLHKKMEMGNERSAFEGRTFRSLFSKRSMVDATSLRYARLCEQTAHASARQSWGYRRHSGSSILLRLLGCGIGLFAGIAIGDSLTTAPAWRVVLILIMAFVGAIGSWYIQEGLYYLHLRGWKQKLRGLIAAAVILIFGIFSGCSAYALAAAGGNLLIGLLAAYTGRRTENGNGIRDEILGLRRHMCRVTQAELMRITHSNPDYYYELAPYALALGVDRRFAKRFGDMHQTSCTWLVTGMGAPATAAEWYPQLRAAVRAMTRLQNRPLWEKNRIRR